MGCDLLPGRGSFGTGPGKRQVSVHMHTALLVQAADAYALSLTCVSGGRLHSQPHSHEWWALALVVPLVWMAGTCVLSPTCVSGGCLCSQPHLCEWRALGFSALPMPTAHTKPSPLPPYTPCWPANPERLGISAVEDFQGSLQSCVSIMLWISWSARK